MSHILVTGIATLDIINQVDHYPQEDEEIRATAQSIRRGGNAANTSAVLQQLGHHCQLACTLADDSAGNYIQQTLNDKQIDFDPQMVITGSSTPTSYICLNRQNASRTIVHYRDLAELDYSQFSRIDLSPFDWCHFEGRNIGQQALMMSAARQRNIPVSLEVEKDRDDIDQLFKLADVILFSRPFALSRGLATAADCLQHFASQYPDKLLTCTWGDQGAWASRGHDNYHQTAFAPKQLIDSLGAGDTFNAGIIHGLVNQQSIAPALDFACQLAGKKCGQHGLDDLESP